MPILFLLAAVLAATFGPMTSASAEQNYGRSHSRELAAQTKRPRVTIYPRRIYPGPNAKRQCRSWLVKEYRVSGPVIVPQMRCWWE
jgi:hypothetical protein